MTSRAAILGILGAFGLLMFVPRPFNSTFPFQQPSSTDMTTHVVATVGSRSFTLAEVEQAAALPLHQIDTQRTKLLHESLQRLIDEELLTAEAARLGMTVPVLLEQASQSETVAKLANLPTPVRLAQQHTQEPTHAAPARTSDDMPRIRQALLVQLRRNTTIHVDLHKPDLPVLTVSADDDPWTGTADAPITIIEFSDFECPYCKRGLPILKELLTAYPGKLKLVYRDFPGPNHPQALPAAEAAQCAAEQNQFWKYHDALFNTQDPRTLWNFSALAEEIGLQPSQFNACMKEHRYREEVLSDLRDGLDIHIASTPTFFINGRPLVGAQPLEAFRTIIESLLHQP